MGIPLWEVILLWVGVNLCKGCWHRQDNSPKRWWTAKYDKLNSQVGLHKPNERTCTMYHDSSTVYIAILILNFGLYPKLKALMEIKYSYLILIITEISSTCILYGMKTTDIVSCNVNHKIINESNIVPFFHKIAFFSHTKNHWPHDKYR